MEEKLIELLRAKSKARRDESMDKYLPQDFRDEQMRKSELLEDIANALEY